MKVLLNDVTSSLSIIFQLRKNFLSLRFLLSPIRFTSKLSLAVRNQMNAKLKICKNWEDQRLFQSFFTQQKKNGKRLKKSIKNIYKINIKDR